MALEADLNSSTGGVSMIRGVVEFKSTEFGILNVDMMRRLSMVGGRRSELAARSSC